MSETRRLLLEFETEKVATLAKKSAKNRKALVKSFSDTSEIVRERALLAAIDLADPTIVDEVVFALEDEESNVRIAAAQALAWYQQPKTIPHMLKGLKDENTWVRSHCAVGLSKLLRGPIWARVSHEDVDRILSGFPDTTEEEIREFLSVLKLIPEAVDQFIKWRDAEFDLEIDDTMLLEELEGKPIILPGLEEGALEPIEAPGAATPAGTEISPEVEAILSELPEEIRDSLPPEDVRRLTPTRAIELVEELRTQFGLEPPPPPKKKKKVKVRKVKRVKKKRAGPTREDLIEDLPLEVRESVGDDVLATLTIEELEALIAATPKMEEVLEEEEKPKRKRKAKKPKQDARMPDFVEKYGEEKAEILIKMPPEMVEGLPEDQIREMDLETLKGLADALES